MITIISGTNEYMKSERLRTLVGDFVAEHGDLALERLDAEETGYERIVEAVASYGFLAPRKLVVLRSVALNKPVADKIDSLLDAVAEDTDLVIVEGKLDKRLAYYKTVKKLDGFEEYTELDDQATAAWLAAEAAKRGGELSRADALYLAGRVGFDQQLLSNELYKLLNYSSKVNRRTIDLLTEPHPRSTIFELLETALAGHADRALTLYDEQRQLRVEPQAILALIAWQLHVLAVVKTAGARAPGEIAKQAGINPYVVNKSLAVAKRLGRERLKQLIAEALNTDIRLKSQPIDADGALKNLILEIAR